MPFPLNSSLFIKKQCSQYQLHGFACFFEMPRFEKKCLFSDKLLGATFKCLISMASILFVLCDNISVVMY